MKLALIVLLVVSCVVAAVSAMKPLDYEVCKDSATSCRTCCNQNGYSKSINPVDRKGNLFCICEKKLAPSV